MGLTELFSDIMDDILGPKKEIHQCKTCGETILMIHLEKHIKEVHFYD